MSIFANCPFSMGVSRDAISFSCICAALTSNCHVLMDRGPCSPPSSPHDTWSVGEVS